MGSPPENEHATSDRKRRTIYESTGELLNGRRSQPVS
ncbi:hypothetical protein FKM82_015551 [Ascaphus truei]